MAASYRIRLAFMSEGDDMPTVIESCDEYTEDSHGGIPEFFTEAIEKVEKTGAMVRTMVITLPESAVKVLFQVPTVQAKVSE